MFAGLWSRIIAGAALVGAVLLAVMGIRKGGRDAERAAQAKREADAMRVAENAGRIVDAMPSDGDGYRSLRDKWTRKR